MSKIIKDENLKIYGIILMILAAIILLGLFSYWKFATWRLIDWAIVIVCGYIGYKIYNKN